MKQRDWRKLLLRISLLVPFVFVPLVRASAAAAPKARRDETKLGTPYDRYVTTDRFGREITFYLSKAAGEDPDQPLVVFVQGSGCDSVFVKVGEQVGGGLQNRLWLLSKGRARVLVVEKPGVAYLDRSKQMGSAEGCSAEFLQEHTLDRWAEAIDTAINAAKELPKVDARKTLVVGHSEGGLVAARVAAIDPRVTHVASLAGGGPTQLFDLTEIVQMRSDGPPHSGDAAKQVYDEWKKIQADPDSTTKFFWGHPYRRWSTFLSTSVLRELSRTKARIYLAQGTNDQAVIPAGFDMLRAELAVQGRDVTAERIVGGDHGFQNPSDKDGMKSVMSNVVEWFLGRSGGQTPRT